MSRMRILVGLIALGGAALCLPARAGAEPRQSLSVPALSNANPGGSLTADAQIGYAGYVAGFNVLQVQAGLRLRSDSYAIGLAFHTSGTMGLLFHGNDQTLSQGVIRGSEVAPTSFVSQGLWRGEDRKTEVAYQNGQPVIRTLIPPNDSEREPVPEAMRRDTIDTLGAMVMLLRHVAANGACEGHAVTFDGRRVSNVTVRTVGQVILPHESRSSYEGQAMQCDVEGRQVAGFPLDAEPGDYVHRPHVASVWFAQVVPGMPPLPVRMTFETRFMGHMTVYMTQAQPGMRMEAFIPPR